jgi:ubiquitin-conjugating enzyme (huntingtin interacting protein 2)
MTSSRDRRVAKELQDLEADRPNSGVYAAPTDGVSLKKLTGTISGPPDTPYAGGMYNVDITIPDQYPFKAPQMVLSTKIWHPNISSQTGAICLDTLSSGWSPVQTIKTALLSIRMLLEVPNPKDPQDAEVASMLKDDPPLFARTAHHWAVKYAGATPQTTEYKEYQASVKTVASPEEDLKRYGGYNKQLVDEYVQMGFEVESVVDVFRQTGLQVYNGAYYQMPAQYHAIITSRLLGE